MNPPDQSAPRTAGVAPPATSIVRIDRGNATPEETAAVIAVLGALRGAPDLAGPQAGPSLWNSHARAARPHPSPGPGAWRGSALPR